MGSETVRVKSGWQGKLSTKGHKCNEARIPTNAFYLKRKAFLPGKQRHDTEIMITCDPGDKPGVRLPSLNVFL